jgi:hypothetical protein
MYCTCLGVCFKLCSHLAVCIRIVSNFVCCALYVTGSHPRPRTSHVVVKVSVSVKRKLDGMERTGRLFLVDLATPEAAIPSHYDVHMADDARDVAVAIYRLGIMSNMHSITDVVQYALWLVLLLVALVIAVCAYACTSSVTLFVARAH